MTDCDNLNKWIISIFIGLLYFVISSPISYYLTNNLSLLFGGCNLFFSQYYPNYAALIIHSIIFTLLVRIILNFVNISQT